MPSPFVQFRLRPAAAESLPPMTSDSDSASTVAADRLDRYFVLTRRALRHARLSRAEALLLCDLLNGTLVDSWYWAEAGPDLLATTITDAAADGFGEKWDVDLDAFAEHIRSWSPLIVLAVTDAVQAWWSSDAPDWDTALEAVGLQRRSALHPEGPPTE